MSNFDILKSYSQEWARWGTQAEEYLYSDPSACVTKLRALAEAIAEEAFKEKGLTIKPDKSGQIRYNYAGYVYAISEAKIARPDVVNAFYANKDSGNEGTHKQTATIESAERALRSTHLLASWFINTIKGRRLFIPLFVLPIPTNGAASPAPDSSSREEHLGSNSGHSSRSEASAIPQPDSVNERPSAQPESAEDRFIGDQPRETDEGQSGRTPKSPREQTSEFSAYRAIVRSNFEFLRQYDENLADIGKEAEGLFANSFPGASAARLRLFAELLAKAIARQLGLRVGLNTSFLNCIQTIDSKLVRHHEIAEALDVIRQLGNVVTHNFVSCAGIASEMMERSHLVASWYVKTLMRSSAPIPEYVSPMAEPDEKVPTWKKFLGTKRGKWAGVIVGMLAAVFGYYVVTDPERRWDRALRKTLGLAAFILLVILICIPFFVLANGITIWGAYALFVKTISAQLGWNQYLIRALGLTLLVPFFYSLRLCVSIGSRRRWTGIVALFVMAIGYNLMFYYATRNIFFIPGTAKAAQYYERTDQGIVFYDRAGYSTTTSQPLLPVTPDVVREWKIEHDQGTDSMYPVDPATHDWFNPNSGAPMLWYSRSSDGKLEFFLRPGTNPRTGYQLSPVTSALQQTWTDARTPKPQKPVTQEDILSQILQPTTSGGPGVLLFDLKAGDQDGVDALNRHLTGVNTSAFPAAVLGRRGFTGKFYQGDPSLIRKALAITRLNSLVIAEVKTECAKRFSLDSDLISCDLTANARRFDAQGNSSGSQMVRGTGAGFNEDAALEEAAKRASSNLLVFAKR
jgi:hypothetical protein